ncbi:unnamed protein product, partial [Amoebophrya sp. A120]|eukprot:GSA120T00025674001.1
MDQQTLSQMTTAPAERIPVFLVTGATGAGKSTLIAHLIQALPSNRRAILIRHRHAKAAMLETFPPPRLVVDGKSRSSAVFHPAHRSLKAHQPYEAGAVTRDDEGVATDVIPAQSSFYAVRHFSEVFDFGSGCVCCAPDGDLMRQLVELQAELKRDHVETGSATTVRDVEDGRHQHAGPTTASSSSHFYYALFVETTGLADPRPFLRVFQTEPTVCAHYELHAILCVVDSLRWEATLQGTGGEEPNYRGEGASAVAGSTFPGKIADVDGERTTSTESLHSRGREQLRVADLVVVNNFHS